MPRLLPIINHSKHFKHSSIKLLLADRELGQIYIINLKEQVTTLYYPQLLIQQHMLLLALYNIQLMLLH
jgi:hypothetical protein